MTTQNIDFNEVTNWRHHLHKHPEIGFDVEDTALFVAKKLLSFGIEVHTGIGRTGIVGVLKCGDGTDAIGLRADMDALNISEANDFDHRSVNQYMHACGHDGHTTMLLAAAQILAQSEFSGTVYFIFQPNEEHGLGAQAMIDDGLFERFPMNAIYGMHNMPGQPLGHFAMKQGAIMAGEDNFKIHIKGRGGHASQPHLHIDPIVIGAEIVQALQTIVARSVIPSEPAVVSVTEFEADGTVNVIASNVLIKGDCRSFNLDVSETIERRMTELCKHICSAHGAELEFEYIRLFHSTTNTAQETDNAYQAALSVVGKESVLYPCEAMTASEDFASMLRVKNGSYIFIGNGVESEGGCFLHNAHYDFNDTLLPIGAQYWVNLVKQQLV